MTIQSSFHFQNPYSSFLLPPAHILLFLYPHIHQPSVTTILIIMLTRAILPILRLLHQTSLYWIFFNILTTSKQIPFVSINKLLYLSLHIGPLNRYFAWNTDAYWLLTFDKLLENSITLGTSTAIWKWVCIRQ